MSLIEYFPGDTFFHRLDPRVKILSLILTTIAIFIVQNFLVIGIIFLTILALWLNAHLPLKTLTGYFKLLLSLFALLTLLQGLFLGGPTTLLEPVIPRAVPLIGGLGRLSLEGIIFGLLLNLRLIALVALLPLVTMTTPIHLFALGLVRMGLSYKVAYTATTAINLIPTLEKETGVIMDAQKMRGFTVFEKGSFMQKMKAYPTLVVPLIIGAMRKAQIMGVAMDVRAFGTHPKRTYIEDIVMNKRDWAILVIVIVYNIAVLVANFVL
ncbi:energy-coupling factor transporter transmembrane component T [Moorella naiadis]|uniref:energy-coupling factor transporter transmembrane component T family protein n=1 Tax=Moorella naiadis (nom. illeg.) TaxID=3093670 RepID=UPI003D9CB5D2